MLSLHRGLILLLTVLAAPWPASGAPTRPYSVRTIAVGVSLTEFHRIRHPDAETHPGAKVYCSNEPGVGGLEALPLIRAVAPGTRVVVLSALEAEDHASQAHERGAAGYIQKGTEPGEVVAYLHQVLARAGSRAT